MRNFLLGALALWMAGVVAAAAHAAGTPFGPNVYVFDPSMSASDIKATVDAVASQQIGNQFGAQRYALLFKPGTYGTADAPLNFQVGYYTAVAGLGQTPGDVVINGSIDVYNQCDGGFCVALNNFWRSVSNLTIKVSKPNAGCFANEFWAVSQAAPMRRVQVDGGFTLMDYCTGPSYASGGFIADSKFTGQALINGSQQQWLIRDSEIPGWSNGVWNQVFSGVVGAPSTCFPAQASCGGPYTTLPTSPVTREAPYLYVDAGGLYRVFVPALQHESSGTSWGGGTTPGRSIPLEQFLVVQPTTSRFAIHRALGDGMNLLLTPGIYELDQPLAVTNPNTVILGLGFPTLQPTRSAAAINVTAGRGVLISGLIIDAGPGDSDALVRLGCDRTSPQVVCSGGGASDPSALHDVFFRIGGAGPGRARIALVVNSDNAILDDVWAWRADHGNGVGWTLNTSDTGLVVNGADVTAYGLFVEHFQKTEVFWNGSGGTAIMFQNEMPYDPPGQQAWQQAPDLPGWPALQVARTVRSFRGYGMGSYSNFTQGINIFAARAFVVPASLAAGSARDLLTVFLDNAGGILNVVNNHGGSATAANPDVPVPVVTYP